MTRVSFWDLPILRLPDPDQAPRLMIYVIRELGQVFRYDSQVVDSFPNIVVIASNHTLDAAYQALGLLHGGPQFGQVLLDGISQLIDGSVDIHDGCVRVIH